MNILPKPVQKLIEALAKLPGIGPKTASRLAFYLLNQPGEEVNSFANSLQNITKDLKKCRQCFNISIDDLCVICADQKRDQKIVLVVEDPLDTVALEKTDFQGVYHILGGVISPIDGVGPENLNISSLIDRLKQEAGIIKEVIISTDPSLEGEATALYIVKLINQEKNSQKIAKDLSVTRIARGLPMGGDVEYADAVTLSQALEGRREI